MGYLQYIDYDYINKTINDTQSGYIALFNYNVKIIAKSLYISGSAIPANNSFKMCSLENIPSTNIPTMSPTQFPRINITDDDTMNDDEIKGWIVIFIVIFMILIVICLNIKCKPRRIKRKRNKTDQIGGSKHMNNSNAIYGVFQCHVIEASHLQNENDFLLSEIGDPFVIVQVLNEEHHTDIHSDIIHAEWNQQLDFMHYVYVKNEPIKYGKCIVVDKDLFYDDIVGSALFDLPTEYMNKWETQVLEIRTPKNRPHGILTIQLKFVSFEEYEWQKRTKNRNTESMEDLHNQIDDRIEKYESMQMLLHHFIN